MAMMTPLLESLRVLCRATGLCVSDEYEKTPIEPHAPARYCTLGLGGASFDALQRTENGDVYPLALCLRVRILDSADAAPAALLDALEEGVLSPLLSGGYDLSAMQISPPAYCARIRKMELCADIRLRCSLKKTEAQS